MKNITDQTARDIIAASSTKNLYAVFNGTKATCDLYAVSDGSLERLAFGVRTDIPWTGANYKMRVQYTISALFKRLYGENDRSRDWLNWHVEVL